MDVVSLARTARENLARGLGALQSPGVPPELLQAAEPVAQAMSALHQLESAPGAPGSNASGALESVRRALAELQATRVQHAAIDQAMEAIASALGSVHQLSAAIAQRSVAPAPPTQPSNAFPVAAGTPPLGPSGTQRPPASPTAATELAPAWGQAPVGGVPAQAPPQPAAAPQPAPVAFGTTAPAAPAPGAAPAPAPAPAPVPAAAGPAPAAVRSAPPPADGANVLHYEAELGAHSPTNFYKGLSGNDVIDSGGIFIATYNIPEVGQPLAVKVCLPGGYEFEAAAVVRWTRDSPQSGTDSSPGFGAQFTQISAEGRQLVYRYVRNREPLFYDDL